MKYSAIILAAGQGKRMNLGFNKMFHIINHKTIIEHSVNTFNKINDINQLIIVVNENELTQMKTILKDYPVEFVLGGQERFQSVYNALEQVNNDYVLIHDGARCFVSIDLIERIINGFGSNEEALCLGVMSKDTIHYLDDNNYLSKTIDRRHLYLAQTPQGFKTKLLKEAYQNYFNSNTNMSITDDAMLVKEFTNTKVKIIESEYYNKKITTSDDC
ncbi:MAG: 2-C-methyl-D-erythritol 4-phosphate cytidylyltransferase [Bacilli bacterium]|jgi:2-C-methyl-D-erythritol 4-phosphate cytidylyltransferase|nr:2-C-methyl-D-erythritol 4-phosphate cytidylyltransferase [Bacilli bacterium]